VHAEVRQIDSNFVDYYNKEAYSQIVEPGQTIILNGWYRESEKIGAVATQSDVDFEIEPANSWCGRFLACANHPQTIVRVRLG
jgi:hypothetical protein